MSLIKHVPAFTFAKKEFFKNTHLHGRLSKSKINRRKPMSCTSWSLMPLPWTHQSTLTDDLVTAGAKQVKTSLRFVARDLAHPRFVSSMRLHVFPPFVLSIPFQAPPPHHFTMYRRRIKKPRAPVFGKTLEEFGFKINPNGRLVAVGPDGTRA